MAGKDRITPAVLGAALRGDLANAIAAMTPGGIEAQEAAGQRQLVRSSNLPKKCNYCTREQIEAMGVVFGADVDDLFIHATLPAGWALMPTDHSMWSTLRDERGRARASVFYKAAFYDREAFISIAQFITVKRTYDDTPHTVAFVSNADGAKLFETERVGSFDYTAIDRVVSAATAWADEHYPDRQNPLAYW